MNIISLYFCFPRPNPEQLWFIRLAAMLTAQPTYLGVGPSWLGFSPCRERCLAAVGRRSACWSSLLSSSPCWMCIASCWSRGSWEDAWSTLWNKRLQPEVVCRDILCIHPPSNIATLVCRVYARKCASRIGMLSHTLQTEVEIRRNDGSLHSHIETLKRKVLNSRVWVCRKDGSDNRATATQVCDNNRFRKRVSYRFSARTFFWHFEHVYMLSPSNMSFTVTSSRDSYSDRNIVNSLEFAAVLQEDSVFTNAVCCEILIWRDGDCTMSGLCTAVVPMRNYLWGDNHARWVSLK